MVDIDIETAVDAELRTDLEISKHYVNLFGWKRYEEGDDFYWEDFDKTKSLSETELKAVNCLLKGFSKKDIKKRIKNLEGVALDRKAESFRKTLERVKSYLKFIFVFKEPIISPCTHLKEGPSQTLDADNIVEYLRSKQYSFLTASQETPALEEPLFGRETLIESITSKVLNDKKSLLLLKGALGIGKKSLSRAIALKIQASDRYPFHSIDFDGFAPCDGEAAYQHFIQKLLRLTVSPIDRAASTDELTEDAFQTRERATILERLTSVPKVIVLDDFEKFTHEGGDPFYVFFSDFLKAHTGSIFIVNSVTSVEFVEDLAEKFEQLVFQKKIKGLSFEAATEMLLHRGMKNEPGITAIIDTYSGNPGELMVIAQAIKKHFSASPDDFVESIINGGSVFLSELYGCREILDLCSAPALNMLRALNNSERTEFTMRELLTLFGASANTELKELLNLSLIDEVETEEGDRTTTTYRINRVVQRSLEKYFNQA